MARRAFLATGTAALALPSYVRAAETRLSFSAGLEQGALVVGNAPAGTRVSVDGRKILVSPEGAFAFGFAFDRTTPAAVFARYADGTSETRMMMPAARTYEEQRIAGLPQEEVTPPPEILARIRRENAMIGEARMHDTPHDWFADGLIWPAPGILSSVYGSRRILNGVPMSPHLGVDIAAPEGTPIHAPAGAAVAMAEPDFYLDGGFTLLDHGHGISTAYVHQCKLYVKKDDVVKRGDVIGLIGQTGRATGPNLHWGLNWFRLKLDPSLSTPTPLPPKA